MADRRLEDLAAAKTQLQVMDNLQRAKNELAALRKELDYPVAEQEIEYLRRHLKDDKEIEFKRNISDLEKNISSLEKEIAKAEEPVELKWGLPFLAAFLYLFIPIGLAEGGVIISDLAVVAACFGGTPLVFLASLFIPRVITTRKQKAEASYLKSRQAYFQKKLEEAESAAKKHRAWLDKKEQENKEKFEVLRVQILAETNKKLSPLMEAKRKKIAELEAKYKNVAVISTFAYSDRAELTQIISALEGSYAESIPEARRWVKAEAERAAAIKRANGQAIINQMAMENQMMREMGKIRDEAREREEMEQWRAQKHREKVEETLKDIRDKM